MQYKYDDYGRPLQDCSTKSNRSCNETQVQILPTKALPIIFLPGLMGSPLRAAGNNGDVISTGNRWAWFPDRPKGWVAGAPMSGYGSEGFRNTIGEQRRRLLNPEETWALTPTDTDIASFIKKEIKKSLKVQFNLTKENYYAMSPEEALRRGWGTVYWSGYGKILSYLEKKLAVYNLLS